MISLQDSEDVKGRIKSCKKTQIEALHKFIFETNGDRSNRQRLREFKGFEYNENDVQYREKSAYIDANLSNADLASCCIILGLDYNAQNLKTLIFKNLCKGNLLKDTMEDDDEEEDEEVIIGNHAQVNDHAVNETVYDDACSAAKEMSIQEDDDVVSVSSKRTNVLTTHSRMNAPCFTLNFRDIEDSIRPFDGSGKIPVESWIEDFQEVSQLMQWNDFQIFIYAKKSLKGLAKLFVMGEKSLNSWTKLRDALLDEFGMRINSAQLHKMLSERKMKSNESLQEYMYHMKDLAAQGNIEDAALIQYIIDGIQQSNASKAMLYGAHTIKQFKQKLSTYEVFIKHQNVQSTSAVKKQHNERPQYKKSVTETQQQPKSRCYKCGVLGHLSANCTTGLKCFRCNQQGHIAKECPSKKAEEKSNNMNLVVEKRDIVQLKKKDVMMKDVRILDQKNSALFDTGSLLNLIRLQFYKKLGEPKMSKSDVTLKGFGTHRNLSRPIGKLDMEVEIDEKTFNLQFHIVDDCTMSYDIVIGKPICEQAEMIINADGIHLKRLEEFDMMHINTEDDKFEIDIADDVSKSAKQIITECVGKYKPVKKKTTDIKMRIILTDETPIASAPRRLPLCHYEIVEKQIEEWLTNGIIEESNSEFSSPIVLVAKKDGSKRLCVDYRRINKVIVRDRFPLPILEDQLDRLQDASIFSTIDLKNGFFHVPIEDESRKYTAFVTHNGQYQFCKVPFGLSNSPAVFQRFINSIFRDLTRRGVAIPYVDDVIIPAKDESEALKNLTDVLNTAKEFGLELNFKKCHFMKKRIEFLGHIIENHTVAPSPSKVEAVVKYPIPTTLKKLESFLGLAGYFRKFIPGFAALAKPLSDLRKKDVKFQMAEEQILSFEILKRKLVESPVLKIFNVKHETELHTDASADGYGAVLLQKSPEDGQWHPCYFMSKKTTELERKYTSYELEILAVVEALKKFRVYLLGINFKIITDCNSFVKTMEKKDLCTRVARWHLLLQEYQYTIEHRSGVQMRHVDALSRCMVVTAIEDGSLAKIAHAQNDDVNLKPILKLLQKGDYENYFMKSNVLYKLVGDKELLVLPSGMQIDIIKKAHEKGHFALKKTKDLLCNDYYIPKMDEQIQRVVANCIHCLLMNKKRGKQDGILHPIPKHDTPLHTYHIDHLGPLESTHKGYKHILAVIDAFTKYCWLYPTKSTTSNEVVTKLRAQSVVFGNPEIIISDRGTAFTAEEFNNYCKDENIKHHLITTGLPRANGQIERLNSTIIAVLSKISIEDPTKWYKHVERVQKYINATFNRSIRTSPFELMIGTPMRNKEDIQIKRLIEEELIEKFNGERDQLRCEAKQQIAKTQEENRCNYNLRRRAAPKYKVGEVVAIKRTQYGPHLKLKQKYLGPYKITNVKANDTYDVRRAAETEGPRVTTTCAEFMKRWPDEVPSEAQG